MQIQVPCGTRTFDLGVPDGQLVGVRSPRSLAPTPDPVALARRRIAAAIEESEIGDKARPGASACIAVTDRTRSTPLLLVVPILLDELNARGVADGRITVISGGGMHAADTREEMLEMLGPEVVERVTLATNEPDNDKAMVHLGISGLGTPVEVHRRFAEADVKLGVINVNPCMLAGWSGGGKIVQPAVSSRASIYHNHKHFVQALLELHCASLMGVMPPQNPVRVNIEECAEISGVDLIVNSVLDPERRLAGLFCGGVVEAQRAAVECMAPYVEVSLPEPVDVLVAAVGEPALEVSLFQGGSRVCGSADRYLKPGGTLIMVNACSEGIYEGFEHESYRQWMHQMPTPAEIGRLVKEGAMGGEKGCVLFTFSW
ncbi:MAG TPA: lactate racemase domain-containing protein, partial [Anaerolineae bacterium]|nr:lactate racemase domain-containing protein [Anaerolineae bacterium]